jgi:parallel beta-helix repeat protein
MLRGVRRISARLGIAAAGATVLTALVPAVAHAVVLPCGAAITTSVTLTADMNCPGTAIRMNASNIVLDLGGHTISGVNGVDPNRFTGVAIAPGRSGDTVRNGTIRGFDFGVTIPNDSNGDVVTALTLDSNGLGIAIFSGSAVKPQGSQLVGNRIVNTTRFSGIQAGGNGHLIQGNQIADGANAGIFLFGNDNVISGNSIVDSGATGIVIDAAPNDPGPFLRNQLLSNQVAGSGRTFNSSQISVRNAAGTIIRSNVANGRGTTPGIFVESDSDTTVDGNQTTGNSTGVLVRNSARTTVSNNAADQNNFGISVASGATDTLVSTNEAARNSSDGFNIGAPSTVVRGNTAYFNGRWGIFAVSGVTDGGGNRAAGNGVPSQCTANILCT